MKLSISKQDLLASINKVIKATASRPSVPYLSGILITVTDVEMTLFASDLETSIQTKVNCLIEETGTVAVTGKILANIINALPETTVHLYEEGEFLKIVADQSEFEIRKINTSDFSSFSDITNEQEIVIPADKLSMMVKKVGKAVSRDESRVVLTGVLLTVENSKATMVATDSFRLALIEQKLETQTEGIFNVLIPGKMLEEAARMIGNSGDVGIEASANQIMFSFDNTKMLTRRLEGKFPNFEQLIPKSYTTKAIIDHGELLDSVKRVSILALNNAAISVDVSAEDQTLTLGSKTQELGSASASMLIKAEGNNNNIAINYSFFIDGLSVINSDTVYLEIQDPLRPGILRAPEENFTYLVMPVRAS